MYSDQGISTEEYEKATYDDLMKTQSEEEEEVECNVAQQANDSVILERKKRRLSREDPDKKSDDCNQSDVSINKLSTVNSVNESTSEYKALRMMTTKTSREKRGQWRC